MPHGPGASFREVRITWRIGTRSGLAGIMWVGGTCGRSAAMHPAPALPQALVAPLLLPAHAAAPPRPAACLAPPALPQVLVVPLPLKPLFPGGIMPVTVTNNKLIKELFEIRKSGCVKDCS